MTAQNKTTIKGYFETGDKPTQAQFADLIDSYLDAPSAGVFGAIVISAGNPEYIQGVAGQVLTANASGAAPSFQAASGGGVTSVALSMPNIFAVTGSPVTSAGTLAVTLSAQAQRTIFAAPVSAVGVPAFRTLIGSDLPATAVSAGTYSAPTLVIDDKGRITSATAGSASAPTVTTTASTSGTTVVLTVDLTTNYSYRIYFNGVSGTTTGDIPIEFSSDGGSVYATTTSVVQKVQGTAVTAGTTGNCTTALTATTSLNGYVDIFQDSTSGVIRFESYLVDSVSTSGVQMAGGSGALSAACNRVKFTMNGGSFDAGSMTQVVTGRR